METVHRSTLFKEKIIWWNIEERKDVDNNIKRNGIIRRKFKRLEQH